MPDDDLVWSRWEEVDRLFARALDVSPAERRALIERLCAGDVALRDAVLDLLARSEVDDERVSRPGPDLLLAALPPEPEPPADALEPGDTIGRYRLLRELGRGGMATVYEAERSDGAYRQIVALKVLRRGLDTDRIVERFVKERQILSDFAHPNVARLLDGGATADGRPFLVVEKVDGEPLTRWAELHDLDVPDRLLLFLQVTSAVQEAHRRLVVHRDLKPSNILVDRTGRPKLLDFGIAKLLDAADADLTGHGPVPLTRRYASPEQLRGEPVTTSSDIYQLGILLFELLAGRHPDEVEVGDGAPAPGRPDRPPPWPSRVCSAARARELRGDLDTIVRKALEPDPETRYRAVEDLAEDVRRHLEGQPIRARRASRPLRVRKWFGRNPWATPVAAVLLLLAAGYVATVTITAERLERERNEARAQATRAERITGYVLDLFESADPFQAEAPLPSAEVTIVGALEAAGGRVRRDLADDPATQAELLASFASIFANLDRPLDGRPLIEEALRIRERAGIGTPPVVAGDYLVLARLLPPDSARAVLRSAVELLRRSVPPNDVRLGRPLAALFELENDHFGIYQDPALGEEALAIFVAAGSDYGRDAAGVLVTLSRLHSYSGRFDEAERTAREALRLYGRHAGSTHPKTTLARVNLARVLDQRQRFDESIPLYEESIAVLDSLLGPLHDETLTARNDLAATYQLAGRQEEAIAIHRDVLILRRTRFGTELHRDVASSIQNIAAALKDLGRWEEADSLAARAYEIYRHTLPPGHYILAYPLLTRTEILLQLRAPGRAESTAREALGILEGSLPAAHYAIGVARCRLGAAILAQDRLAQDRLSEAASHVRAALTVLEADERTPSAYYAECEAVERRLPEAAG